MKKYILKRFLQLIPVLLGITFLSFAMMRVAGSDAITELYGDKGAVAQEVIDAKRAELGLDQPFLTQYFAWLGGLLTGDMGVSYVSGRNVFGTFVSKLPATLLLTALSIVATVLISIPLGVLAAVRHDKFTDYFLRFFSFVGNALPNFFVALLLMQVFSVELGWLPTVGADSWRHYILPSLTLGAAVAAVMARFTRASFVDVLHEDYMRTARAKGVSETRVVLKHGLRNAMIPVVTMMGLQFGFLLGGSIVVEKVFNWPGLGRLLVDSVEMRDYPVIQAEVLLFSLEFILINLVVDVLYAAINPAIRYK